MSSCLSGRSEKMKKAFTLIELLVAVGILAMVLSFSSLIFRTSIESQRTASANAEIMRKLRAITDQLNADFQGLRKDGEIFVVWDARPAGQNDPNYDHDGYVRFDRIMFFADGDFQSYGTSPKIIRGNVARISYMLAKRGNFITQTPVQAQLPEKRILTRTQHIYTADPCFPDFLDPTVFPDTDEEWYYWNNWLEYDKTTLDKWKNISPSNKQDMLTVIADVNVVPDPNFILSVGADWKCRGTTVDPADPNSIHILLCAGVGEFKVQGWYDDGLQQRWVPEVDPNGDGILSVGESDFYPDPNSVPGVLYPYPPYGMVIINNITFSRVLVNEANFNSIPGLGRALKFTFTLYDSKGVIKDGRTFTHIVYLDN